MNEIINEKSTSIIHNRRVYMANERTFFAWIRTSIGIMAFGFVVEKFAMFIKQMSLIWGKANIENTLLPSHGYSVIIGIFLVGLGTFNGTACICQVQEG
jgi:putative membrane protein